MNFVSFNIWWICVSMIVVHDMGIEFEVVVERAKRGSHYLLAARGCRCSDWLSMWWNRHGGLSVFTDEGFVVGRFVSSETKRRSDFHFQNSSLQLVSSDRKENKSIRHHIEDAFLFGGRTTQKQVISFAKHIWHLYCWKRIIKQKKQKWALDESADQTEIIQLQYRQNWQRIWFLGNIHIQQPGELN